MPFAPAALLLLAAQAANPAPPPAAAAAPAATPARDPREERLRNDWAYLARYREANAQLPPPDPARPRVVFMGDSITEGWVTRLPGFFAAGDRVGRGISGQTTPQMLVRFREDVIALRPRVVHIMAGTNDVAGNTGPMQPADTQAMIRSMVDLARANGIAVILGAIPPADLFPWRPAVDPGARIVELNGWLQAYAAENGLTYADYWTAMRATDGLGMREGLAYDRVHPTAEGYEVMAPVAERAIAEALAKAAQ